MPSLAMISSFSSKVASSKFWSRRACNSSLIASRSVAPGALAFMDAGYAKFEPVNEFDVLVSMLSPVWSPKLHYRVWRLCPPPCFEKRRLPRLSWIDLRHCLALFPSGRGVSSPSCVSAIFLSFEVVKLNVPFVNRRFLSCFTSLLRREEGSRPTGSSYFLIACLITVPAFPRHITTPAILFVSLGDPIAAVVGVWKGHITLWGKSVEGHMAWLVI